MTTDDEKKSTDAPEILPPLPNRAPLTVRREGALAVGGVRVLYDSPAGAYLASLHTPKSRLTAVESMRRIARAVEPTATDPAAWARVPWARLRYAETNMIRNRVVELYAPATARLTLSVLRGVLRSAFRLGQIEADAYVRATSLDRVRGKGAPPGRMLAPEEVERLYARCDRYPRGKREMMRALLSCGLGGGLRREELVTLRTAGVQGDELHFIGKGRKEAVQKLPEWAAADVGEWVRMRAKARPPLRAETLFVRWDERADEVEDVALTPTLAWEWIVRLAADAGIERFTPHDMRRTFISRAIAQDVGVAKTLARHENLSTTLGYDRRGQAAADEVLKGMTRS